MKIGIFGGSFNPPHIGHRKAAEQAIGFLKLDRLLVVPAGIPPHKNVPDSTPPAEMRLLLTRKAFESVPEAEVSDFEMKRQGKSYTIDTLRAFRSLYPEDELTLIVGTDMFLTLPEWYEGESILSGFPVAVFPRGLEDMGGIREKAEEYRRDYGAAVTVIPVEVTELSSTEVRTALPGRCGRELLDESVYREIIRYRLYGAKPEFAWLREKAYAMLKPKRIPHVAGCEQEAVFLAKRWGLDPGEAAEAGILHDITKRLGLSDQLLLCKKYGITIDGLERQSEKLLHSKTGAAVARAEFGVSDEVYSAIFWHTTGKADMTEMEKLLYLADYVEPNRSFEGVEKLRRLCREDLNRAMCLGLQMSVEDLTERGAPIHSKTEEALRWYQES